MIYDLFVFLVGADEAASDDNESAGDEDIVSPRLYFSDAQSRSDSQDYEADDKYDG
jgi:hypothetical protein